MKRITDAIKKIAIHTALVYLAMLVGFLLLAVLVLIIPGAGQTSTLMGKLLDPPFWLSQVICGATLGWWVRRHLALRLPVFAVIIPTLLLCVDIVFEGLPMRTYTPLADIYFSSDSSGTEGVYKLMFVAPLYTAIAYTLGALAGKLIKVGTDGRAAQSET